jgi:hypothetical protein
MMGRLALKAFLVITQLLLLLLLLLLCGAL